MRLDDIACLLAGAAIVGLLAALVKAVQALRLAWWRRREDKAVEVALVELRRSYRLPAAARTAELDAKVARLEDEVIAYHIRRKKDRHAPQT